LAPALASIAGATIVACSSAPAPQPQTTSSASAAAGEANGAASTTSSALPPTAPPAPPVPEPEITSTLALATFDAAWTRIHETDFDPEHGGVDWIAVREEFRPKAAECDTNRELRQILSEMIARLERSHFGVIPGDLADRQPPERSTPSTQGSTASTATAKSESVRANGSAGSEGTTAVESAASTPEPDEIDDDAELDPSDPAGDDDDFNSFGLALRVVEGRAVVAAVEPESPASRAGVRPGWALIAIDGRDPAALIAHAEESGGAHARYAAEAFVSHLDMGSPRRRVPLVFLDLDDTERTMRLRREPMRAEVVKVGTLPAMPWISESRWLTDEELDRAGATGRRIGLIRFSIWMPAVIEQIDRAVDEMRSADGIVLDLRGNPGGFAGMVMGIGGHFVAEPVSIGSMSTRETTLEFRLNPRRATRDGRSVEPILAPLAILVDPLSASTSEVFAGGFQDIGRARVFGETSAGAVLPAQLYRLPNGDVLLHAFADFKVPSGGSLEGRGVIPPEPTVLTRQRLAQEQDPALQDAIRWIRNASSPVP